MDAYDFYEKAIEDVENEIEKLSSKMEKELFDTYKSYRENSNIIKSEQWREGYYDGFSSACIGLSSTIDGMREDHFYKKYREV